MKDKNIAGILALFLGFLGVHRFYLEQVGWGIFHLMLAGMGLLGMGGFFGMSFLAISWIISLISAIYILSMDTDEFNIRYNKKYFEATRKNGKRQYNRRDKPKTRQQQRNNPRSYQPRRSSDRPKHNPFKQTGIKKFRDFDYRGAIEDFEKALEISPNDVAVHFNLACAYSLVENAEKSFYHLDKAVENEFNDFDRIKNHDALAFIRVQPQFEQFQENGYRLVPQLEAPKENLLDETPKTGDDLIQQLKELGELREKGLLTNEEFEKRKQRLLRGGK